MNERADRIGHPDPRRASLEPVQILVADAQSGVVAAQHALAAFFAPMLRHAIAPYHHDRELYEELAGEVQLFFHNLILQFDPGRGVNLFTYLDRTLPLRVRKYVQQRRVEERREAPWSSLLSSGARDAESESEEIEDAVYHMAEEAGRSLAAWGSVEQTAVDHVVLEEALQKLPPRQREVFRLRIAGYEYAEIAAALGTTAAACRQAFQRAQAALGAALKSAEKEGDGGVTNPHREGTIP